jgi:hypothetical protein
VAGVPYDASFVEFLLERTDGDTWVYRRRGEVTLPIERLGASGGFLALEVALLYKMGGSAAARRPEDEADVTNALPLLTPELRVWLEAALGSPS